MYQKTRDLEKVRKLIEAHQAQPAVIKDTDILKLQFSQSRYAHYNPVDELEPVNWHTFCDYFKQLNMLFLYETNQKSAFYKFILDPQHYQ